MIQHCLETPPTSDILMGIINTVSDPIFVKNEAHQWVFFNDAFCELLGLSAEKLLGKSDYEFFPKEEADVFWKKDEEVFKTEKININEEFLTTGNGEKKYISTKKSILRDEHGNKYLVGTIQDITEIKRYEIELETLVEEKTKEVAQKHAYLRRVIDSIPNLIFVKDRERRFTLTNKAFQYAYKGNDRNIIGEQDHNLYLEEDLAVFETGEVLINERDSYYDPVAKETVWISTNKTPLKNEKGEVTEVVCISVDISPQVKEEEERKSTERKYQLLLETLPGTVCEIDDKGFIQYVSPQGLTMFGYDGMENLKSKNIFEHFVKHEHEQIYKYWKEIIKGNFLELLRIEAIHKDGHTFYLEGRATVFGDPKEGHCLMFFYDISDKVKAERQLLERESLLNAILNSVPDDIWAVDRHTNLIAINTNCQKTLKYNFRVKANIGDKMQKILKGNQVIEKYWNEFSEQILEGETVSFAYIESSPKSKKVYRENILAPIHTSGNEIIGVIGISRNVTKRKEHESALAENEKKYRTLFESSPYAVLLVDIDKEKRALECNGNWIKMLGSSSIKQVMSKNMLDLSPIYQMNNILSKDKLHNILTEFRKKREPQIFDWIFTRENGDSLWGEVHFLPINLNGEDLMMMMIRDIGEKRRTQQDLEESELLFRSIFENAYDGIAYSLFDKNTEEELAHYFNQKMLQLYDFSKKEYQELRAKNKNLQITCSPKYQNGIHKDIYIEKIEKELHTKKSVAFEWALLDKNEKEKNLECTTFLVETPTKNAIISILKNITKRKKNERTIQEQLKDLSLKNKELKKYIESNMQLENFAYMASHDLQSPLKTITSFVNLLQESLKDKMTEQEKEFCSFIMKSTQNLQALIQDLLAYSRTNTEKIKVEKIKVRDLLEMLQEELKTLIQEKKATIYIEDIPKTINGDYIKIKQLFQNLITNAIKFVKPDTLPCIYIRCKEVEKSWEFSVQDNGIGISKKFYEKIFLIFKRLHIQEEYKGTGIGLALCKKIVEQHKGTIWIDSKENLGSIFYFTINKDL